MSDRPTHLSGIPKSMLDDLIEVEHHQFPEHLFVSVFLPMFAADMDTPVEEWLRVASNVFTPVDIIGKDGKVLFTVPPLMRKLPVADKHHPSESLYELWHDYEEFAKIHPNKGAQFLKAIIANKVPRTPADVKDLRTWNSIFERYGYPLIELSPATLQGIALIESQQQAKDGVAVVEAPKAQHYDFDDI